MGAWIGRPEAGEDPAELRGSGRGRTRGARLRGDGAAFIRERIEGRRFRGDNGRKPRDTGHSADVRGGCESRARGRVRAFLLCLDGQSRSGNAGGTAGGSGEPRYYGGRRRRARELLGARRARGGDFRPSGGAAGLLRGGGGGGRRGAGVKPHQATHFVPGSAGERANEDARRGSRSRRGSRDGSWAGLGEHGRSHPFHRKCNPRRAARSGRYSGRPERA